MMIHTVPDPFEYKLDLTNIIKGMLQEPKSSLSDPELRFDITPETVMASLELLKQQELDLKKLHNKGKVQKHLVLSTKK